MRTGVESCDFLPQSETTNQLSGRAASTESHRGRRAHTFFCGDRTCAFVLTVRLGNVARFVLMTDTGRQLRACTHAGTRTGAHTL